MRLSVEDIGDIGIGQGDGILILRCGSRGLEVTESIGRLGFITALEKIQGRLECGFVV